MILVNHEIKRGLLSIDKTLNNLVKVTAAAHDVEIENGTDTEDTAE